MGLLSFIKNAGAKLGIGKSVAEEAAEAAAATAAANEAAASKMIETVSALGIEIESMNVVIDGELATVTGVSKDQSSKEKAVLVVGNTEGIAQVDDQIIVDNPEPEATYYTVEKGDYLSKIAKEVYGDAMKYPVIFEANKPMLSDPDKIYPGQVLRIPPLA